MYYSATGLLAALVLCIVNWDILCNAELYGKNAWSVYRRFLFAVLAYFVTDVLWGIFESMKLSAALFLDTTVYFMTMAVGISFWADYTVAFLNARNAFGRILAATGRVIVGLILVMTIVNVFKPVLFTVDSNCTYQALPIRHTVLICQIVFLIMISLFALTCRKQAQDASAKSSRYLILAAFGIIMAACLFAQLWFPYLPLYSIAYMLGTCLLHAFIAIDERDDHRRQLEEAARISELKERFRALLDNMPGMTFTKDAETGRYLACNQAFARYARKESPEGVTGLTDAQIFDAETAAHFAQDDKIALSLSKPYIFYEDVQDAAGNPRQLQTTKLRYKDTSGRACVLGMCQDVTDLVSIQREQSMTKEAYESAVRTGRMYNHIAQTLARDYTEMFYVNKDSEEFTEYRRGEKESILSEVRHGWHFFSDCKAELSESIYPDDREAFLAAMNRKTLMHVLSGKDTFLATYRRLIRNQPVYFSMKVSRMENDEQYIIIGFMDMDAEMREAIAKNKALTDALSSAEAANHDRMTFLAGMSHEIRTPINAIIGLETLARKNPSLDAKARESFERIGDSACQLLSLINEILEMSRFESGSVYLHNTAFSLSALLEQINTRAMTQCTEKQLSYECSVQHPQEDTYIGDERKLGEALLCTLGTVIRLTDAPGSIALTVEKAEEHGEQVSLRFCIRTDGKAELAEAFSGTQTGSNLLGAALAKRIAEMMNGSISAGSAKDGAMEVTVMVSLRSGDDKELPHTGEMNLQALSVLVVDDNSLDAEHAAMVLEEAGIRTDVCANGQEALRRIELQHTRKQPYSFVLLEWSMSDMNGSEVSAEIHRLYENESLVVAMTSYSWDDIREEAHAVGVDACLEKPLFAENVIRQLERIAQRSGMAVFQEKKKARMEGRRILLAEDVELNAEILTEMLEMENIKVDHAENGRAAVELFAHSTEGIYSAILMDVRMPEMDGLEAARRIRAMHREDAGRIPIIALTGNTFDEDVQLSIQAGMNAHLTKPVDAERLIQVLGELIYEAEESLTGK